MAFAAETNSAEFSLVIASGIPAGNAPVAPGTSIRLAGPSAGISKVKFYLDGTYKTSVKKAPFVFTVNEAAGKHELEARIDANGRRTKVIANIEIGGAPSTPSRSITTPTTGTRVSVSNTQQLEAALNGAKPGHHIVLAAGNYAGQFELSETGVTLSGPRNAVLNAGSSGYGLHLTGANNAKLFGFSITGGKKGLVLDQSSHVVIDQLDIGKTGEEGVHFRNFSADGVIQNSTVHDTGLTKAEFGEGIYIGSAKSNWGRYSGGKPDLSNNVRVINNTILRTGAENIDIKESTSGGIVSGNKLDGSAISGKNFADSLIDVKGSNYRILNNVASGASAKVLNGFETHVISGGGESGNNNVFGGNKFLTALPGSNVNVDPKSRGTIVR